MKTERGEAQIAVARWALLWERVWPALWPATGLVGLYVAVALFGAFGAMPRALHALALVALLSGTSFALYRGLGGIRMPGREEATRRVECDSGLLHRPLSERADRLAAGTGDAWSEALWRAHGKRLLRGMDRIRFSWPRSRLPLRDPQAFRYAVLLALVAGMVAAGPDWRGRLSFAFSPAEEAEVPTAALDAWIDPPAYTGQPPVYFQRDGGKNVAVPAGSVLMLRVHAASVPPQLTLVPEPVGCNTNFTGSSEAYAASCRLQTGTDVRVREAGRSIRFWHIRTVADQPPMIAFSKPPGKSERGALKLSFTAGDDYGVTSARALIRPVHAPRHWRAPLVLDLPLPSASAKTVAQTVYRDLTADPLAGLDVEIVLQAKDGAGQSGYSRPARIRLPARIFSNPLARALVEQRQNLAIAAPHARERAVQVLDALSIAPDRFYAEAPAAFLALRAASWGLKVAHRPVDITRVQDLLWETAIGLDSGGLLDAAERLRQLQQLLSQALARGASQDEVDALLQGYREALQRYLQALAQNSPQSNAPLPPNARVLTPEDLAALLNAIQRLAQTGARGQAQQALAMLQSLLENLHLSTGSGKAGPSGKALSGAIHELGDLIGRQRQLLDKSFRQGEGAGDPADGGGKGLARLQGQLRGVLGQLLQGLGRQKLPQPDALGRAGREMGDAQTQLGSDAFGSAGDSQRNALDALREGIDALAKQFTQQGGQGSAEGTAGSEDPFGRELGAGAGSGNVRIPGRSDVKRARAILEELRKRASQPGRSREELDYIDRLLKTF